MLISREQEPLSIQEIAIKLVNLSIEIESQFSGKAFLFIFGSTTYLDLKTRMSQSPRDIDLSLIVENTSDLEDVIEYLKQYLEIPEFPAKTIIQALDQDNPGGCTYFDLPAVFNGFEATIRIITKSALHYAATDQLCIVPYKKIILKSKFKPKQEVPSTSCILISGERIQLPIIWLNKSINEEELVEISYPLDSDGVPVVPRMMSMILSIYENNMPTLHQEYLLQLKAQAGKTMLAPKENFTILDNAQLIKLLIRNERFSPAFIGLINQYLV